MNQAEEIVYKICRKSFLSLWSYANPRGKKNKELCDVLVVFNPYIIIFSVKNISLSENGDERINMDRWLKAAVEKSVKQLYGARKWLEKANQIVKSDGLNGLTLPPNDIRKIMLVSVSLGSKGKVPLSFGDYGAGYVHIFDEISFATILQELDTISDFIAYLEAKESLGEADVQLYIESGGEEDLLGYYLANNRQLLPLSNLVLIADGMWKGFIGSDSYRNKREADRISYVWDNLVEVVNENILQDQLEIGSELKDSELAVRIMAREDRFARRILGQALLPFIGQRNIRSRVLQSPSQSKVTYVFLMTFDEMRQYITAELAARCFCIRGMDKTRELVVGIAIEQSDIQKGFALTLVYLHKPEWSSEDDVHLTYLQNEFGYYLSPVQTNIDENEYPSKE